MSEAPPSSSVDRIGQLISARYRIVSLVGEGGMGAVYLAEHTLMRKRVALKLLHAHMAKNEEVLARFQREAEAAAHVEHPNIVAATDFGQTEDGAFFLVLEFVDGTTLRQKLAEAPFATTRALHIARQIALALERAHEAGIVHRDLKPENVMLVTKDDDPDFVKVLDFGVSRIDRPSGDAGQLLTQAGTIMGSPSYMAPEQAVADRVTHRADLYSLGCVLFEMLTNEVPFSGDVLELLTKHVTAPVPRMAERAPGVTVPLPVEAVVRKLLEKDANDRYPNARAVVEAIDQAAQECGLVVPGAAPVSERKLVALAPPEAAPPREAEIVVVPPAKVPALVDRLAPYRAKAKAALSKALSKALAGVDGVLALVSERMQLPKRMILAIAGGIAILAVVLVIILVRREPRSPSDGLIARTLGTGTEKTASPEAIRAAATKGPAGLEELASTYPKDLAVLRELAFAYDAADRSTDALRVVRQMAEADAKGIARDVVRVVIRAASKVESSDEAFRLLEGPLGSEGIDGLMELAEGTGVSASTASRARESLAKPSVRANATPAVAFVLDLARASTCDEKHDVLVRAGGQADGRALTALRALESRRGCGRRKKFDCHSCLRKDDALTRALEAAQSKRAGEPSP